MRTVSRVIEVIPTPVKIALGALFLLALILGAGALRQTLRARGLVRRQGELLDEVELFSAVLVPAGSVEVPGLVAASALQASQGGSVGGELVDAFELFDGQVGVVAASVTTAGIEGLTAATTLRYALRGSLAAGAGPREAILAASRGWDGGIATIQCGTLDPRSGRLVYASAGAPTPVAVDFPIAYPSETGAPLGMGPADPFEADIVMPPGGRLVFFTSALEELRTEGEMLGRGGIARIATQLGDELTADALVARAADEADSSARDLAACVVCWEGATNAVRLPSLAA